MIAFMVRTGDLKFFLFCFPLVFFFFSCVLRASQDDKFWLINHVRKRKKKSCQSMSQGGVVPMGLSWSLLRKAQDWEIEVGGTGQRRL